jgi:hypothetical protein
MIDITLLQFVIFGLASYRLTRLFTRDMITAPFRNAFWKKFPPESSYIGYLSTCEWCFSFWIAAGLMVGYSFAPSVTFLIAIIYAISAVAGLLTAYEDK